jgi:hypothetical protein
MLHRIKWIFVFIVTICTFSLSSFANFADPEITPNATQRICDGKAILFKITNAATGDTYQWMKDEVDIPNANKDTLSVFTQGKYKIKVTNGTEVKYSTVVEVIVNLNPWVDFSFNAKYPPDQLHIAQN